MRTAVQLLLALTASLALVGCQSTPMVSLASDPPGAQVLIDNEDSGFVTPCALTLTNRNHRVDLVLPGYSSATRFFGRANEARIILWNDMLGHFHTWRFPLWLNYGDFFIPVETPAGPFPTRIFVRMRRPSQS